MGTYTAKRTELRMFTLTLAPGKLKLLFLHQSYLIIFPHLICCGKVIGENRMKEKVVNEGRGERILKRRGDGGKMENSQEE